MQRQMYIDRELFTYMAALPTEQVREIILMLESLERSAVECKIAPRKIQYTKIGEKPPEPEYEAPTTARAIQDWRLRDVITNIRNKFLIEGGI